jgi:hypothetical protein
MGSHFISHKLRVLKIKEISPLLRGITRLVGRISLSPLSNSHRATCPHPISSPSFLFFSLFSFSPSHRSGSLSLSPHDLSLLLSFFSSPFFLPPSPGSVTHSTRAPLSFFLFLSFFPLQQRTPPRSTQHARHPSPSLLLFFFLLPLLRSPKPAAPLPCFTHHLPLSSIFFSSPYTHTPRHREIETEREREREID